MKTSSSLLFFSVGSSPTEANVHRCIVLNAVMSSDRIIKTMSDEGELITDEVVNIHVRRTCVVLMCLDGSVQCIPSMTTYNHVLRGSVSTVLTATG